MSAEAGPTFLGLACRRPAETGVPARAVVVGVAHGTRYPGAEPVCAGSPEAIRAASQRHARFLGHHDFDLGEPLLPDLSGLFDAGDVPTDPDDSTGNTARARDAVAAIGGEGAIPFVLGGDDSVVIPFLRGLERGGPVTVLQVDAHLDFRDEVHGIREGYSSPMRRASEMAWVERIIQVGLRGVGSARTSDVDDARAAGNLLVTADEVRSTGIQPVLDLLAQATRLAICLDLDGLDPSIAPGVSGLSPGGLSFPEGRDLMLGAARSRPIAGIVVTELAPARDPDGLTALIAVRLLTLVLAAATAR